MGHMSIDRSGRAAPAYASLVRFCVLGPLEVLDVGRPVALGGPKQQAVLAILVAAHGRPVSIDSLIQGVYGEDADSSVRRSVQTFISNLRQVLGGVIERSGGGYRLVVSAEQIDAALFETTFRDALAMLTDEPDEASASLRAALAMWRGHAYAEVVGGAAIDAEVARLEGLRLDALLARVDADLELGLHCQVVGELEDSSSSIRSRNGSGRSTCWRSTARVARSTPFARTPAPGHFSHTSWVSTPVQSCGGSRR